MSNQRRRSSIDLLPTGVTAGTYGSAVLVPVLVIDAQGRVTSATTASPSPDLVETVWSVGGVAAGQLVYMSGWNVTNSIFEVLEADADDPAKPAQWIVDSTIAAGASGTVSKRAVLTAVNTNGATVDDPVYLSATAGSWTLTAPTGGTQSQQIVGRVAVVDAAAGSVALEVLDAFPSKLGSNALQLAMAPTMTGQWTFTGTNPQLTLGTAGTTVGGINFKNATSGSIQLQPVTGALGTVTLSLPAATDTLVGKDTTDTLTNKTLTAPKFASGGFIADANGNELLIFTTTGSAVNEITIANGATGNGPTITASGETNVPLTLAAKGTGKLVLGQATMGSIELAGLAAAGSLDINGTAGTEILTLTSVASAVNEITISNSATGGSPDIAATGDDADIPLTLTPKGTGNVRIWLGSVTLETGIGVGMTLTPATVPPVAAYTISIPNATDTLVNLGSAQVLTNKTLTSPVLNQAALSTTAQVVTSGTPISVTAAMSGRMFIDNSTADATTVYSLPDAGTTQGLEYSFQCANATSAREILINPAAGDSIKCKTDAGATGTGVAPAAGTGIKNTAATNVVGDSITLRFDGVDTWWAIGQTGVWASQ